MDASANKPVQLLLPIFPVGCGQTRRVYLASTAPIGKMGSSLLNRFFSKINIKNETDCWNWQAGESQKGRGYGSFWYKDKNHLAHRISWMLFNGYLPEGMCICHHCDNPSCVNPRHLFIGTRNDNIQDAFTKGRLPNGENHYNARLTRTKVNEIRNLYDAGNITTRQLAEIYSVSQQHISRIINLKRWKNRHR